MTDKNNKKLIKILLAEDDKFISRAYFDGLTRAGFKVTTAFDGNEALVKAKAEIFDLILLDLIMPVKNGFETLTELKVDPATKNIPVIILSNLGQDSDIKQGRDLGAVDYLIKSNYTLEEVEGKIRQYIK